MRFQIVAVLMALLNLSSGFPTNSADSFNSVTGHQGPEGQHYDILMTKEELQEFHEINSGLTDERYRWPNRTLPYTIHSRFTAAQRKDIATAQQMITSQTNNCIRFKQRTNEKDYVSIIPHEYGCDSYVGRRGGVQNLRLADACFYYNGGPGVVTHELIHALGFDHEQNREDRDNYVRINWDNIEDQYKFAFDKSGPAYSTFDVGYDYDSIMHYGARDFGKTDSNGNQLETITVLQANAQIGQNKKLSKGDAQKLKNMYKCK